MSARGVSSAAQLSGWSRTRGPVLVTLAVAVAIAAAAIAAKHSSTSDRLSTDRTPPRPSESAARAGSGSGQSGTVTANSTAAPGTRAASGKPVAGIPGSGQVPLAVKASNASGLRDGDPVSIHVAPTSGSVIYGFEARLCRGDTTYGNDADMRPTLTGKCVSHPLSTGSDDYLAVRSAPPYSSADANFRVGEGTDTFRTRDGRTASVTCGPDNPCTIVLELQYPNGYGFQTIPVTYR